MTLIQFGAITEAKHCTEMVARQYPHSVDQSRLQAFLASSAGDFGAAFSLLGSLGTEQWGRAQILQNNGRSEEALVIYRKLVPELFAEPPVSGTIMYPGDTVAVADALISTGAIKQAHRLLRMGIKDSAATPIAGSLGRRWSDVYAYALLGEYNSACAALAEAAEIGYFQNYTVLSVDPALAKLRQQPCFDKQYGRIRAQAEAQVSAARRAGLL